jgi:hypothetical protein
MKEGKYRRIQIWLLEKFVLKEQCRAPDGMVGTLVMNEGFVGEEMDTALCFWIIRVELHCRICDYFCDIYFIKDPLNLRSCMKRKMIFLISCVLLVVTLACDITMEGINFSGDPSPEELERTRMAMLMTDVAGTWQSESGSSSADGAAAVETAVPITRAGSAAAQPKDSAETRTYSVQATNYDCICAVDGDVEVSFNFKGDTLEVFHSPGVATEYTKIGENRYSRSFMGFYILDGEEVPEQKQDVITFMDTGYTIERFSGDLNSPCCVHTFTNK